MLGSESAPHDLDCVISPVLLLSGCLALKVSRLEHLGTKIPIPILASRGKYCQGQTSLSYLPAKGQGQSCPPSTWLPGAGVALRIIKITHPE